MQADVARLVFTDLAFDAAIPEHRMMRGQRGLAMASEAIPDPKSQTFHRAWMEADSTPRQCANP
jgi:hypothetical protein